MKLFECQNCGQLIYFENVQCERCGLPLGFLPDTSVMTALDSNGDGTWTPHADRSRRVLYCANQMHGACNWLVEHGGDALCTSCQMNRTIPDLSLPENLTRWQRIERAKRRLTYSLLRLGLPVERKEAGREDGLAFDFLAPQPDGDPAQIMTGHANGVITLNVAEADDPVRAQIRDEMGEMYRTLLGHMRHEAAHYYFERLVAGSPDHQRFRALFGDETADYAAALETHYLTGAPPNWQESHISAYASAHPHEDWAETFAHYLHMVDTLETAYAFGIRIRPRAGQDNNLSAAISFDPYSHGDFDSIIDAWLPMTFAVNSINRSMGIDDLYPFVISQAAIAKLRFVHQVIGHRARPVRSFGQRLREMVSWSII
jgi:hypothetical protein